MGSLFVVVAQALRQGPGSLVRGPERTAIGPAPKQGSDEPLRRKRKTAWEIAQRLRMVWSTVSAVLQREGLEDALSRPLHQAKPCAFRL